MQDLLKELEAILEYNSLDECWLDWLRECEDGLAHLTVDQERIELLQKIRESETAFSQLDAYVQARRTGGANPQRNLDQLIVALDLVLQREIDGKTKSDDSIPTT